MKKLSHKLFLIIVFTFSILLIGIFLITESMTKSAVERTTNQVLEEMASSWAKEFDILFARNKSFVGSFKGYIKNTLNLDVLANSDQLTEYFKSLSTVASGIVQENKILNVYVWFNPDLAGKVKALSALNMKLDGNMTIKTDETYSRQEIKGPNWEWFWGAEKNGINITEPYDWEGYDEQLISYTESIKIAGKTAGVVGTDTFVGTFKNALLSKKILDTGYFALMNKEFKFIFHPTAEGKNLKDIYPEGFEIIQEQIQKDESGHGIVDIGSGASRKIIGYNRLKNSWYLVAIPTIDEIYAEVNQIVFVFTIIFVASIMIVLLMSFLLSRSISKPIIRAVTFAETIAKGDLSADIEISQKDEIGRLGTSLRNMIKTLREKAEVAETIASGDLTKAVALASEHDVLGKTFAKMSQSLNTVLSEVNKAVSQVTAGAGQVSDSSQALSQGASQQAAAHEEITSSITELTTQTNTNAENATKANQQSMGARDAAERGNVQMQEMISAVSGISESSTKIAKIIKTIDDIAFQTNLLALNAAVEAARAGQHGKGFAVVAQEVRALAGRSATAAQETTELIEDAIKRVDTGTVIVDKTAETLNEIVDGSNKVSTLVAEIADASNQQAQGLNQVSEALTQIEQVTQQNSATAEETASSSEELSGQATELRRLIRQFKLREENEPVKSWGNEQETEKFSQNQIQAPSQNTPWGG